MSPTLDRAAPLPEPPLPECPRSYRCVACGAPWERGAVAGRVGLKPCPKCRGTVMPLKVATATKPQRRW